MDVIPAPVVVTQKKIIITDKVYFKFDSDVIKKESFKILVTVAKVLKNNPEVTHVTIVGHTSDDGDDAHNLELSKKRARAVRKFLVNKGIAPGRLSFEGKGEGAPLVPNDSEENREKNRRVEFLILQDTE